MNTSSEWARNWETVKHWELAKLKMKMSEKCGWESGPEGTVSSVTAYE